MIIFLSIMVILIIACIFAKRLFIKRLQTVYEQSLLKGDKKKCIEVGKIYFLSLDEKTRKTKGIVNIDEKISDDFRAFNSHHLSVLL